MQDIGVLHNMCSSSLDEFLSVERNNISSGVSERNLCARFSIILERIAKEYGFHGYYADTEYNRKQNEKVKTILDDDYKVVNVTCDLILHSRGEVINRDNLIAIEMKKSTRPEKEKHSDRERLRTLTKSSYDGVWSFDGETHPEHVCGYEMGIFVELDIENGFCLVQRFEKGDFVNQDPVRRFL